MKCFKKAVAVALALVMALAVAGCGNKEKDGVSNVVDFRVTDLQLTDATKAVTTLKSVLANGMVNDYAVKNGAIDSGSKKVKYVYFGSYPQEEVTGKFLNDNIKNANYDANGYATVNGVKYKRIQESDAYFSGFSYNDKKVNDTYYDWTDSGYHYFKVQPIKWRILYSEEGKLFLQACNILDDKGYNETHECITWAGCSLRTWLNTEFLNEAFTEDERECIILTHLTNPDPKEKEYSTKAGADTDDKVFILSYADVLVKELGFTDQNTKKLDPTRALAPSDYAFAMGCFKSMKYETDEDENGKKYYAGMYYLRTPGNTNYDSLCVRAAGGYACTSTITEMNQTSGVGEKYVGVCPCIYLNLGK